jgi:hypothetical protein
VNESFGQALDASLKEGVLVLVKAFPLLGSLVALVSLVGAGVKQVGSSGMQPPVG